MGRLARKVKGLAVFWEFEQRGAIQEVGLAFAQRIRMGGHRRADPTVGRLLPCGPAVGAAGDADGHLCEFVPQQQQQQQR